MTRRELIAAALGLLLAGAAIWLPPIEKYVHSETLITESCRIHTTQRASAPVAENKDVAIIFHGLSANRKLMEPVARWAVATGLRAYLIDMPGHGDSAEPFSFERAEQCAAEFLTELTKRGVLDPRRTVLIGHSMGASIAIRLADRYHAAATIAISPAPLTPQPGPWQHATPYTLPQRLPSNLLVFIASLDPFPIRDSAKQWAAAGPDHSDADFTARRALRLTDLSLATHVSVLVDTRVALESADWLQRALAMPRYPSDLRTPPFAFALALLGVMLLFPAVATLLLPRASAGATAGVPFATWKVYATWAAASLLAAVVLKFWIPLAALRLFSGDYLASFLLIVGLAAIAVYCKQAGCPILAVFARVGPLVPFLKSQISDPKFPFDLRLRQRRDGSPRSILAATLLAFVAFLAASWLLAWQATDVWLNVARSLRFPFVLLAAFPYALAEELALGPPRTGTADVWRRLLRALALRAILFVAMLAAFLLLRSNQILIPLLALYLLLFSIAQRLGADAIRRRTGSAAVAAVFGAILTAWFIAAVFPLL